MFAIKNKEEINTFSGSTGKALVNKAEVRNRMPSSEMEFKDLDKVTTKEEVYNLLVEHVEGFSNIKLEAVTSLRKAVTSLRQDTTLPSKEGPKIGKDKTSIGINTHKRKIKTPEVSQTVYMEYVMLYAINCVIIKILTSALK